MATKDNRPSKDGGFSAIDVARLRNGSVISRSRAMNVGTVSRKLGLRETNLLYRKEHDAVAVKIGVSAVILAVLVFFSLCLTGAAGQYYPYSQAYQVYSPADVSCAIYLHAYNAVAELTHWFDGYTNQWLLDNCPGYWAIFERLKVVVITLVCAVLLGVAGMLYQNVFKNPIAGPNMLGASSGISFGMMVLVALNGANALSMINERYLYCYGFGAAILVFVILAGKKLSGPGRRFDLVTMLLIGSILGQLLGFVVQYMTLFVMDESDYQTFFTLSQMLTVDTSATSWVVLGVASLASFLPIYLMRFKMNALAFSEEEVKLFGINYTGIRALALVCGAVMMLAAQIHTGAVGMITLIVPFMSRSWFGCEFSKQFTGCLCIGTILLLACRDITDMVPFIGDGLAIGSVIAVVALPLFIMICARGMRGWE